MALRLRNEQLFRLKYKFGQNKVSFMSIFTQKMFF
jgi:hypothetical protein